MKPSLLSSLESQRFDGGLATASAIDYVPRTEYDIETCLDISRIRGEFGFEPEHDLERGLSSILGPRRKLSMKEVSWVVHGAFFRTATGKTQAEALRVQHDLKKVVYGMEARQIIINR